jgi:hypothetical protein
MGDDHPYFVLRHVSPAPIVRPAARLFSVLPAMPGT